MPFFHPKNEEYKQSLLRDIPKEDCQTNETSKHFIQWISFQDFFSSVIHRTKIISTNQILF